MDVADADLAPEQAGQVEVGASQNLVALGVAGRIQQRAGLAVIAPVAGRFDEHGRIGADRIVGPSDRVGVGPVTIVLADEAAEDAGDADVVELLPVAAGGKLQAIEDVASVQIALAHRVLHRMGGRDGRAGRGAGLGEPRELRAGAHVGGAVDIEPAIGADIPVGGVLGGVGEIPVEGGAAIEIEQMLRPVRLGVELRLDPPDPVAGPPRRRGEDVVVVLEAALDLGKAGKAAIAEAQGLVFGPRTLAHGDIAVA